MTKIWNGTDSFFSKEKIVLTIGTFDGVHLGHQKIIARLNQHKSEGFSTALLTFNPHPRKVLFPEQKDLKLINTNQEKIELFEHFGIDHVIIQTFNFEFSSLSSDDYIIGILKNKLNIRKLIIGYDHRFGKNREGGIELLKKYAEKLQFQIEEIPVKEIDSINISSSNIRKAIEYGNIDLANQFLGYFFFLNAVVVHGKKLGRTIGFPTANLELQDSEKIVPGNGVYAVKAHVKNEIYKGMMNIGLNPSTNNDNNIKLELHLFDFDQDIYSEKLKIEFHHRLRDEKKFDTLEQLVEQLKSDEVTSRKVL